MEDVYKIYCSNCNRDMKKKMSWVKYLNYMSFDGRSKGYHYIPINLVSKEPNKCPFGHPIKSEFTLLIKKENIN